MMDLNNTTVEDKFALIPDNTMALVVPTIKLADVSKGDSVHPQEPSMIMTSNNHQVLKVSYKIAKTLDGKSVDRLLFKDYYFQYGSQTDQGKIKTVNGMFMQDIKKIVASQNGISGKDINTPNPVFAKPLAEINGKPLVMCIGQEDNEYNGEVTKRNCVKYVALADHKDYATLTGGQVAQAHAPVQGGVNAAPAGWGA